MPPTQAAPTITHLEAITFQLPLRRDWRWRGMEGSLGRWVLIRLRASDGTEGFGEATPLPDWGGDHQRYYGETPESVCHIATDVLAPAILGVHALDHTRLYEHMNRVVRGHFYAKAAVEMAALDLAGKLLGQPVYRLLGGAVRDRVQIAHMIGLMPIEEAAEEARMVVSEGVRALQIKGTGDSDEDLALVRAVRSAAGDGVALRFDANQGYRGRSVKEAIHHLRALVDAGVTILEQPTEGLEGMAAIRAALSATVIADESVWQAQDALDAARINAVDALSVYIAKAGGVRRALFITELAAHLGLPSDVNGSLESGVGNAANLHLALAAPNLTLPSVIPATTVAGDSRWAGRYFEDDLVTASMQMVDGALLPLDGPGLGVEVDEDKLRAFRVNS